MIDGYFGDREKLDNSELVLNFLNELPGELGMKKLAEPVVYFAEGNDKKDPGGWSGFVVIMESHISLHTFPKKGFLSADVYSCRGGFDKDKIVNKLKDFFGLKETETNFVIRGKKFPVNNIY